MLLYISIFYHKCTVSFRNDSSVSHSFFSRHFCICMSWCILLYLQSLNQLGKNVHLMSSLCLQPHSWNYSELTLCTWTSATTWVGHAFVRSAADVVWVAWMWCVNSGYERKGHDKKVAKITETLLTISHFCFWDIWNPETSDSCWEILSHHLITDFTFTKKMKHLQKIHMNTVLQVCWWHIGAVVAVQRLLSA